MKRPRQLRKISNGAIFQFTEKLAQRSDMVPVWPGGVNPNTKEHDDYDKGGLVVKPEGEVVGTLRSQLQSKLKIILTLQRQLDALAEENSRLLEKIENVRDTTPQVLSGKTEEKAKEPEDEMPTEERINMLISVVSKIYEENNSINFTGQGKPRIPIIEEMSGLSNVSAAERDAAISAIDKD